MPEWASWGGGVAAIGLRRSADARTGGGGWHDANPVENRTREGHTLLAFIAQAAATISVGLLTALAAAATPFTFTTGNPDGLMATRQRRDWLAEPRRDYRKSSLSSKSLFLPVQAAGCHHC